MHVSPAAIAALLAACSCSASSVTWLQTNTRPASHELHETVWAVKQMRTDVVTKTLLDVSDPSSPNYGCYWTYEQVGQLVRNPNATAAVVAFLTAAGAKASPSPLSSFPGNTRSTRQLRRSSCRMALCLSVQVSYVTPFGEYIRASAPFALWESVLSAEFRLFTHTKKNGRVAARSPTYTIPPALANHVAFVACTPPSYP